MSHVILVTDVNKRFSRGERRLWRRVPAGGRTRTATTPGQCRGVADCFWALRDISFDVAPGEAFGIIGPNGAGKSTMLKLLAGILRPTGGTIALNGRVSALIEVGAGFHPDLTGRENVYLNASILGLSRAETRRRFDDIVAFAGIGDFLDTPIKRYSSGMYARLGFSVAVHADPEILLVDEVLSVGDRVFRNRCMDRMREFLDRGVAIVFVSHNLNAVTDFCRRAMVLSRGRSIFLGPAAEAVARYQSDAAVQSPRADSTNVRSSHLRASLLGSDGVPASTFQFGDMAIIDLEARLTKPKCRPAIAITIARGGDRVIVFEADTNRLGREMSPADAGAVLRVRIRIRLNLLPGQYDIACRLEDRSVERTHDRAIKQVDDQADDPTKVAQAGIARFTILGQANATGLIDVAPQVEIRDTSPDAAALKASA